MVTMTGQRGLLSAEDALFGECGADRLNGGAGEDFPCSAPAKTVWTAAGAMTSAMAARVPAPSSSPAASARIS